MPSYSRKVDLPGRTAKELYDRVSKDIDQLLDQASAGGCDIKRDEKSLIVEAKHSLFSANLICKEGVLQLDVKLGLLATPFRSKIDQGIDKWLAKNFGLVTTASG